MLSTKTFDCPFLKYSKAAARLSAGGVLKSKPFEFHGRSWRFKVYPAGLSPDTGDFVAVFVKCRTEAFGRFELTVAILDGTGRYTVFDDATARSTLAVREHGHSKGYVEFARRREIEASSCLHTDTLTVQCTLSVDATVVPKPSAFPWGFMARNRKAGGGVAMDRSAPYMDTGASSSTSTRAPEIVSESHTLTIASFSAKKASLQCGECVRSAQFGVGGSNWYIKVYPNGHDDGSRDSVSCFLARGKSGEPETTAEFTFELVNAAGNDNKSAKVRVTFANDASNAEHLGLQRAAADLQQQMRRRDRDDDRLVVRCRLGVFRGKPPSPLLAEQPTITVPPDDLAAAFLWLLNSKECSDITYEVGGTPFRAHSCVLAARSRVFRQQVRELNDRQDNLWRNIQNEDEEMTANAFEALLHVVYTDQLPDMTYVEPTDETVAAMLFAAERYDVERLKLRCEEWLCTFVTPLTVADILCMAVRYGCQLLQDACVRYAAPEYIWELVKQTEGFLQLRASCPHIVREIESKHTGANIS
jgi:speckle-type POZ protein